MIAGWATKVTNCFGCINHEEFSEGATLKSEAEIHYMLTMPHLLGAAVAERENHSITITYAVIEISK